MPTQNSLFKFIRHSGQAGDSWRDPESRKIANLDAGFLRHDDMRLSDLFCELLDQDTSCSGYKLRNTLPGNAPVCAPLSINTLPFTIV